MHPPCEMMVDSFLPAMREVVAKRLAEEGLSQGKIANLMGVTQASVSLYVKSTGRAKELLGRLQVSEEEGRLFGSVLAEDLKKDPVYAVNTLYALWSEMLGRGSLCGPHRAAYPQLANCEVCMRTFGGSASGPAGAIEHVAEAVRMVESSSSFVAIMPEVSVNIAYAPEGASSTKEIVAVPGRIVKVRGAARSFMRPEYGASTHVANVLLVFMRHDPLARAAMNVRYDQRMSAVLKQGRLETLVLDAPKARGDAAILHTMKMALNASPKGIRAVADPGSPGMEPGLYLFAKDALEVVRVAIKLATAYAGSPRRLS